MVVDETGAAVEPHTCIFPILKEEPGAARSRLVGTGCFISTVGHFVTAKHVVFDVWDPEKQRQRAFLHALHFVEPEKYLVRHITRVSFHNTADVAVGKMDYHVVNRTGKPLRNRVPRFTLEVPRYESEVVTFAYPESDAHFWPGSRSRFVAKFYSGRLLEHSEQARDQVLVSWPHYVTSIDLLGGASGGPAFDEQGRVFGINCVGGLQGLSYLGRVAELLPLGVPEWPPWPRPDPDPTVLDLAVGGKIVFDPPLR